MHPFVVLLARLAIGTVWLIAGSAKLVDREPRGRLVTDFGLLPDRTAAAVGRALPYIELTLGALLIAGLGTVPAAAVSAVILGVFSLAIAVNLARGHRIECRCFGRMGHGPISWLTVVRNLALISAALVVAVGPSEYLTLDGWRKGTAARLIEPRAADLMPVLLLAIAVAAVWLLGTSALEVVRAIRRVDTGLLALTASERQYLARWMGRSASSSAEGDNTAAGTGAATLNGG